MSDTQRKLDDGTIAQGVTNLAENGDIAMPVPLFQPILIGNARNFYPDKARGFVFGKRTGIDNTSVDLWEGPTDTYVFPTAPMQMKLTSTSDGDSAAGTGVQAVHIEYLDANYKPASVEFDTGGIAGVLTLPEDILRINGFHATRVGANGRAVGALSLTNVAGTVTYGFVNVGENTARQAIYTVPDGFWGYVNHWQQSSGSTGSHFCQMTLDATTHLGELYPGVFLLQDEAGSQNGGSPINFPIAIPIPPRADVKIRAASDAPNANVTALGAIMGWFEPIVVA
jgi:hypothetical protein